MSQRVYTMAVVTQVDLGQVSLAPKELFCPALLTSERPFIWKLISYDGFCSGPVLS
jgi:hypothetical protein